MGLLYLPDVTNESTMCACRYNNLSLIDDELSNQKYERVGLDRLYAILEDVCVNYGASNGFSFLDVGCNNGFLSKFLAGYGNKVVGIDNGIIDIQNRYEKLEFREKGNAEFYKIGIEDYFKENHNRFDFVLLLSVAHQWEKGYAGTGLAILEEQKIRNIFGDILSHTDKAIYYECPIDEPGFEKDYGLNFLRKYVESYEELSVVKLMDTIASNGYIRQLYRISKINNTNNIFCNEEKKDIEILKRQYELEGSIVRCGAYNSPKYGLIDEQSIILPIRPRKRDNTHPWGSQKDIDNKKDLLSKIKGHHINNVVSIYDVYDDYIRMEFLFGRKGMKTNDIPLSAQSSKNIDNPIGVLRCLSNGLAELHSIGIAHGDPYPYNAIIDGNYAKWIDLGNITDDSFDIKKDIGIFFLYTVSWLIMNSNIFSHELFTDLTELIEKKVDYNHFMKSVTEVFSKEYSDIRELHESDIPFVFGKLQRIVECFIDENDRYLIYYQAFKYHVDFISWMNRASYFEQALMFLNNSYKYTQKENIRLRASKDYIAILEQENKMLKEQIINSRREKEDQNDTIE